MWLNKLSSKALSLQLDSHVDWKDEFYYFGEGFIRHWTEIWETEVLVLPLLQTAGVTVSEFICTSPGQSRAFAE